MMVHYHLNHQSLINMFLLNWNWHQILLFLHHLHQFMQNQLLFNFIFQSILIPMILQYHHVLHFYMFQHHYHQMNWNGIHLFLHRILMHFLILQQRIYHLNLNLLVQQQGILTTIWNRMITQLFNFLLLVNHLQLMVLCFPNLHPIHLQVPFCILLVHQHLARQLVHLHLLQVLHQVFPLHQLQQVVHQMPLLRNMLVHQQNFLLLLQHLLALLQLLLMFLLQLHFLALLQLLLLFLLHQQGVRQLQMILQPLLLQLPL